MGLLTTIEVGGAELHAERGPVTFTCLGLGSCVCVALWDPTAGVGGMVHVVLPSSRRYRWQDRPGMFADRAPAAVVAAMKALGARPSRLVAKVTGGANIFTAAGATRAPIFEIGARNTAAVLDALHLLRLPVVAEDLGGTSGRSIEFSVADGRLRVRTTAGAVKEL